MTPDDFLSRLSAGLDRDEQLARAAAEGWYVNVVDSGEATGAIGGDAYDLLLTQNPDRLLRQVEAIRKLIRQHAEAERDSALSDRDAGFEAGLYAALESLASIYADPAETGGES
ncbi:DUF6221 family protein [Nocardia nova]|uniref:DUF6221 family protein n=1 Tax=Nocardia nova TaxID=37330 RepID=UPI002739794B|nr:DUF6221 family protein [Nocardia nova]